MAIDPAPAPALPMTAAGELGNHHRFHGVQPVLPVADAALSIALPVRLRPTT